MKYLQAPLGSQQSIAQHDTRRTHGAHLLLQMVPQPSDRHSLSSKISRRPFTRSTLPSTTLYSGGPARRSVTPSSGSVSYSASKQAGRVSGDWEGLGLGVGVLRRPCQAQCHAHLGIGTVLCLHGRGSGLGCQEARSSTGGSCAAPGEGWAPLTNGGGIEPVAVPGAVRHGLQRWLPPGRAEALDNAIGGEAAAVVLQQRAELGQLGDVALPWSRQAGHSTQGSG